MTDFLRSAVCLPSCSAIKFNRTRLSRRSVCAGSAVLLLLVAACPRAAGQATPSFVVNTNADDAGTVYSQCGATTGPGTCTLRDALAAAGNAGAGKITFDETVFAAANSAAANTIVLANGALNIPGSTTITGLAPTLVNGVPTPVVTVSGNNASTVFSFAPSQSTATASIANLNIVNGNGSSDPSLPYCNDLCGGGIYVGGGTLTVTGSILANNSAPGVFGSNGLGGGIENYGTLTVIDSTFSKNYAAFYGGAIWNNGMATVTGSTFTNNSALDGWGGGIYNGGTMTVTDSVFSNSQGGYGGAISNAGTLTVTGSTFSENSNTWGGGIFNYKGKLTVTGSTFTNNSAYSGWGGGIYNAVDWAGPDAATLALANDILDGNGGDDLDDGTGNSSLPAPIDSSGSCSGLALCNAGGNVVGTYNGNTINAAPISLAPLGSYGGSTQTLIPLPGSAAICAGTATPGGGLTLPASDQRGDPRTNTSYGDYSSSRPCVDAGAVQTSYAMEFTTEPEPISPATAIETGVPFQAAVTLNESGVPFGSTVTPPANAPSVTIPLTLDGDGTLTGGSAGTVTGVATYPALLVSMPDTGDTLTADLTLNSGASPVPVVSAPSEPFSVVGLPVAMTTPTPGSTLGGASATFTWNEGVGFSEYKILVGTTGPGSANIYNGSPIAFTANSANTLSVAVSGIPTDGVDLYVTLGYIVNGSWQLIDYTYTESGTPTLPSMTTPMPDTTLSGASATFTWNEGAGPIQYELLVGTTGSGSTNLYNGSPIAWAANSTNTLSVAVSGIPEIGAPVYVTLGYELNGAWQFIHYTYTEATLVPTMITPAPNSTLSGASATFTWNEGIGPSKYYLRVGTNGPGSVNVYDGGPIAFAANSANTLSVAVSGIPTDGVNLYVTLGYYASGAWEVVNYTYTEPGTMTAPSMTTPAPGSTLSGSSATFTWNEGGGSNLFLLWVGTNGPNSYNIYHGGYLPYSATNSLSVAVSGIPEIGATLYVTLGYSFNGKWYFINYTYAEVDTVPTMISPTPGTTLEGASATFTWNEATGPSKYYLRVGTNGPGSVNVYDGGPIAYSANPTSSLSVTVTGIPTDGVNVYVTLGYFSSGVWQSVGYTYTEQGTMTVPSMTTPVAGTTLSGSSATFTWNEGVGSNLFLLWVGTNGPNSYNIYHGGYLAYGATNSLSVDVTGIPTDGVDVYATLGYSYNGKWHFVTYIYTESGTMTPPSMTTPVPGSTLSGTSATFTWNEGAGPNQFLLRVGTNGPGTMDVYSGGLIDQSTNPTNSLSVGVNGIPTNGIPLYVTLEYSVNGISHYIDYTYTTGP